MSESQYKVISDYSDELVSTADIEQINLSQIDETTYHLLHDNQSVKIEVESANHSEKSYIIIVNGNKYSISIKDEYDQLIEKMGLNAAADSRVTDILAPMPGLILDILVKEGDEVSKGDQLLVLEAMKMENVIKAAGDGKVEKINATKGEAVDKGQVIIEMQK